MSSLPPSHTTPSHECVRCGKCLAVCPFYRVVRWEECSPRGRILLSERFGVPDTVRCFACLRCARACPYLLSPLARPGQRFTSVDDQANRPLFDYIYYGRTPSSEAIRDPLFAAWRALRTGAPVPDTAPRFENGELFHPFLDLRAGQKHDTILQAQ